MNFKHKRVDQSTSLILIRTRSEYIIDLLCIHGFALCPTDIVFLSIYGQAKPNLIA